MPPTNSPKPMLAKRRIGSLELSVLGVGCNQFGPTTDAAATARIVHRAIDLGVHFFDTADEYGPDGRSEELLGEALRGRRDQAVIATKFGAVLAGDERRSGASRRWIFAAVEESLRRLGTDYIDLYQQHFPDPSTPPEETMAAIADLVERGKVREFGICNASAAEVREYTRLAEREGFPRPVTVQARLNLLRQEAREELVPTLRAEGIALLPYFPLASGLLTGKYAGGAIPSDSRLGRHLEPAAAKQIAERAERAVTALDRLARDRGHTISELAIAWLRALPEVGSVIAGATRPEQIEANVRAIAWDLSDAEIEEAARIAG